MAESDYAAEYEAAIQYAQRKEPSAYGLPHPEWITSDVRNLARTALGLDDGIPKPEVRPILADALEDAGAGADASGFLWWLRNSHRSYEYLDSPRNLAFVRHLAASSPKTLATAYLNNVAKDAPDYATLNEWLGKKERRPIGHNRVAERDGDDIHIRLYNTNVVTLHPDGSFTIRNGGWHTPTTAATISHFTDAPASVRRGVLHVNGKPMEEGMRIQPKPPTEE